MDDREAAARQLCAALRAAGHRALLAGGCVRDLLLGTPPKDFDVATDAAPGRVAALFPRCIDVGAAFGTMRVPWGGFEFEVTTFRSDGPYLDGRHPSNVTFAGEREDAARRDFTINALFLDPETDAVIDHTGGQADLEARIVRAVGDPARRFAEDHLRLLRAVRFAARLDCAIDPATFAAVQAAAPMIRTVSAERVRDELIKMLTEGRARRAFELLDATGLLEQVLPEIAAMKGVEQPPEYHPEGDVYVHTLLMLEQLHAPTPALALGVLLHDVGKPPTQTFEDRIRFNCHDRVGAEMAEGICRRLRCSNAETEEVVWLVGQHMRVAAIPEMRESKRKRFVRDPRFDMLLELHRIDCRASHAGESIADWIAAYRDAMPPEALRPAPLLTGRGLIAMGYAPGPVFKEILAAVEDAQLEGRLADAGAARAFVRGQWPPARS